MPRTSTSSDRMTVDIPRAARLLGVTRKAAYAAAERGDIPVTALGTRKVVAKGWLCNQLHLSLDQLDVALAQLDTSSDDPRVNPDLAAQLADCPCGGVGCTRPGCS